MKITNVSTEQDYRYIPLKEWDSVVNALNIFASGSTKGSGATENHQVDAVARSSGAMGLALYVAAAPHLKGASNKFVEQVLANARMTLEGCERWNRSFDYDGLGPFFKTDVDILVLDREDEMYALGLWAAYVGDEPEIGLAEHFGISRALTWSTVEVQVEPLDEEHFAFDFEQLVRRLDKVLGTREIRGVVVANAMWQDDPFGRPSFPLYSDEDVVVTISPGRVEHQFIYDEPGKPRNTWVVDGAILTGLLAESYEDRTKKDLPTVVISITSVQSGGYRTVPIYDPAKKEHVLALTERIAQALQ